MFGAFGAEDREVAAEIIGRLEDASAGATTECAERYWRTLARGLRDDFRLLLIEQGAGEKRLMLLGALPLVAL